MIPSGDCHLSTGLAMSYTTPSGVILLSFRPIKLKLFRSKRCSLLVIDGCCTCGSLNRIRTGDKAQVRVRPSAFLKTYTKTCAIDDIEYLAISLMRDDMSTSSLFKGCWVDADPNKRVVMNALANIELNRKGDRLVECTELLAVHGQEVGSYQINDATCKITYDQIEVKNERHKIFARWLIDTYGKERLSQGSGVLDVAGGNGMISQSLTEFGVPSTLLDPNPRNASIPPFKVIPLPLYEDCTDLTSRDDDIGDVINNCSLICGLHPDQATEPIVMLALRLNVPFAIAPCCVFPSLFPNRVQRRYNNMPVRSYSAFCQYLLDLSPTKDGFQVDYLPFGGRNKVIYWTLP